MRNRNRWVATSCTTNLLIVSSTDIIRTQYQEFIQLLLQVAHRMGWTYISMVYSAGSYGDGAAADIQNILRTTAADYGICLAVMARIPSAATDEDYDEVVNKLAGDVNARVVIAYIQKSDANGLFNAVRRLGKVGWFIWLASDSMSGLENSEFIDTMEGLVYANLPTTRIPGYQEYLWSLSDVNNERYNNQVWLVSSWSGYIKEYWSSICWQDFVNLTIFQCYSNAWCDVIRMIRIEALRTHSLKSNLHNSHTFVHRFRRKLSISSRLWYKANTVSYRNWRSSKTIQKFVRLYVY